MAQKAISAIEFEGLVASNDSEFSNLSISGGKISNIFPREGIFKGVKFTKVNFQNIDITCNRFYNCSFSGCEFHNVNMRVTRFEKCEISSCKFFDSSLFSCRLYDCWLHGMNLLSGGRIPRTEFYDCDLRDIPGLQFDGNVIRNCLLPRISGTFSGFEKDYSERLLIRRVRTLYRYLMEKNFPAWLVLQRHYTVSSMMIYLTLTFLALLPLGMKAAFWKAVGDFQKLYHQQLTISLAEVPEWTVGQIILALDGKGFWEPFFVIVLLVFNFLRIYVTTSVVSLNSNQELTSTTPFILEYKKLFHLHVLLKPLWVISIGALAWKLSDTLLTVISVP